MAGRVFFSVSMSLDGFGAVPHTGVRRHARAAGPVGAPCGTTFHFVHDGIEAALSPVLFGAGVRLFEGVDAARVALEQVRSEHSSTVTHLTYTVRKR